MTQDDIKKLAIEASDIKAETWSGGMDMTWDEIERFAELVAAAEREWQPEEKLFTEAQALDIAQKLFDSAALNAVPIGWVRKKEWQGLTKEELSNLATAKHRAGAMWAAAKLKEKNT